MFYYRFSLSHRYIAVTAKKNMEIVRKTTISPSLVKFECFTSSIFHELKSTNFLRFYTFLSFVFPIFLMNFKKTLYISNFLSSGFNLYILFSIFLFPTFCHVAFTWWDQVHELFSRIFHKRFWSSARWE